jgi:hypothetical protein
LQIANTRSDARQWRRCHEAVAAQNDEAGSFTQLPGNCAPAQHFAQFHKNPDVPSGIAENIAIGIEVCTIALRHIGILMDVKRALQRHELH